MKLRSKSNRRSSHGPASPTAYATREITGSKRGSSGNPPIDAAASLSGVPICRRRRKLAAILFLALLAGLILGRHGLRRYQVSHFAAAAKAAETSEQWGRLNFAARQWLEHDPDSAAALLYASLAADKQGEFGMSAEYLRQIPDSDPAAAEALDRLVVLYIGPLNRPDLVEPTLLRLKRVASDPTTADRELLRYYGITAQRDKETQLARELILGSNSVHDATFVYLMEVDAVLFGHGEELCSHWLASGRNDELYRVALLVNRARSIGLSDAADQLVANKQREQTLASQEQALLECLADYPNNLELLSVLISTAIDRGNTPRVAELLGRVPISAGQDARFYRYKGWVHRMREEYPSAEAALRHAIALDRYDWRSRHQLAEVLRFTGQPDQVAAITKIAAHGAAVRKAILSLDSLQNIPSELLSDMRQYAESVGDSVVAARLGDAISKQ